MATISSSLVGGIYCAIFITLEAIQSVYFGAVFQRIDSFLIGAVVFAMVGLACLLRVGRRAPAQLWYARRAWPDMAWAALATTWSWFAYFIALQLLEPAVVYTVFSGMLPLVIAGSARLGIQEASGPEGPWGRAGNMLIAGAVALLCLASVLGWTGFTRGGMAGAVGGVLAILSGAVASCWTIFSCRRLDRQGLQPDTLFVLRYVPYVAFAGLAAWWGIDSKGPVASADLAEAVAIGVLLIALPSYLVQRAIVLVSPLSIGVAGALGPFLVFGLQALQGRVAYSSWSLAGVIVYSAGALIATVAQVGSRRSALLRQASG